MKKKLLNCLLTSAAFSVMLGFVGCGTQQTALEEKTRASSAAVSPSPVAAETLKSAEKDSKKNVNSAKSTDKTTGETGAAENSLIGVIKTPPTDGFGCYMVLPADINKSSDKRRYVFIVEDEGGGVMNIDGDDVSLRNDKSSEVKSAGGKKKFVWIFSGGTVKVTINLTQTKTSNEGANTHFDAVIKADKGGRTHTIQAKGFCGG